MLLDEKDSVLNIFFVQNNFCIADKLVVLARIDVMQKQLMYMMRACQAVGNARSQMQVFNFMLVHWWLLWWVTRILYMIVHWSFNVRSKVLSEIANALCFLSTDLHAFYGKFMHFDVVSTALASVCDFQAFNCGLSVDLKVVNTHSFVLRYVICTDRCR